MLNLYKAAAATLLAKGHDISDPFIGAVMAGFGFSPQNTVRGMVAACRICEAHFVRER
jgi:hypothetical protein